MTQISNRTQTIKRPSQADAKTAPETIETNVVTRTMLVKFMETDRKTNTVTYVQRTVGITGAVRHFALTVKMKPKFWRKFLKSGPLPSGTMISLTLEQGWNDDEVCTYATDFSLAPDAAAS